MDPFSAAQRVDDAQARRQGIGFVDGTSPGYVALLGDDAARAPGLVTSLAERQMVVFVAEDALVEPLRQAGIPLGWDTRVVPLDMIRALGFVLRIAQVFGGAADSPAVLQYARERLRGFTVLLGEPSSERLTLAQSALPLGCPLLSTADLPPSVEGWSMDGLEGRAAIGGVEASEIVQTGIEERGLRVHVALPELPVEYGSDFAGEVVRDAGADLYGVELTMVGEEVVDGRVRLIGPDLEAGLTYRHPYGLLVEVSGHAMQPDFESVLERQIETLLNDLHGVMHRGQRANAHLRISREAVERGFRLRHLGQLLHARFHNEFGSVVSRVQITVLTDPAEVEKLAARAQAVYERRDRRLAGLTDETVDTFYTCTLCQSIAAGHLCVISPEHPGVCGAQDWMDTRAAVSLRPVGPNRAVEKQGLLDARLGQWESINRVVQQESGGTRNAYSLYSLLDEPGSSCGDFECITAMLPSTGGVMVVDNTFAETTPSGMDWSMLYETVGGGLPAPGFLGHSKRLLHSGKFISAEGGWRRIVWMNHSLREEMRPELERLAAAEGLEGFVDKIATEQEALSEDAVLSYMEAAGHPALGMDPMM